MKKMIKIIMAFVMCISLVGCAKKEVEEKNPYLVYRLIEDENYKYTYDENGFIQSFINKSTNEETKYDLYVDDGEYSFFEHQYHTLEKRFDSKGRISEAQYVDSYGDRQYIDFYYNDQNDGILVQTYSSDSGEVNRDYEFKDDRIVKETRTNGDTINLYYYYYKNDRVDEIVHLGKVVVGIEKYDKHGNLVALENYISKDYLENDGNTDDDFIKKYGESNPKEALIDCSFFSKYHCNLTYDANGNIIEKVSGIKEEDSDTNDKFHYKYTTMEISPDQYEMSEKINQSFITSISSSINTNIPYVESASSSTYIKIVYNR